jgi:hypothetical protein
MTTKNVTAEQFAAILETLPEQFTEAAIRGLRSAAMRLEGWVVDEIRTAEPHPAVAQGELAGSVVTTTVDDGAIVKVEAPHGAFMEEGTRPHFPPLQPLEDWVRVKGFAKTDAEVKRIAYAVALKIAQFGIAPRHFFAKAVRRLEVAQVIPTEIARELNGITG